MENHRSTSSIDRSERQGIASREPPERHVPYLFLLAGASLLTSLFVPIGLGAFTEWSWLAGIGLVGLAVLSVCIGLLGLYPAGRARTPRLAIVGVISAAVAGAAGLTVIALSVATATSVFLPGVEFSVGMRTFVRLALTMAGGYSLGFLAFGLGGLRSSSLPRRTGQLLAVGGLLLAVPVVGGLAQLVVEMRLPAWVLFPVLGLVAVDTLAVGLSLRSAGWVQ